MNRSIAAKFVHGLFRPSDRLAVVLVNKRTNAVTQRIASAERIEGPGVQGWLRHMNASGHEVYISMNGLKPDAQSRTKDDVATIRNIYLDFDNNGSAALHALSKRRDVPMASLVVNTSPDKWQVIWQVEHFSKEEAEKLQRHLACETGADPAATDCSRVLRLPGFYNHKYERPHLVRAEPHAALTGARYRPEEFPTPDLAERGTNRVANTVYVLGALSQSERDWAYAIRALSRGEPRSDVMSAIVKHRPDKHDPHYYAALTVQKATEYLSHDELRDFDVRADPER